MTRSVHHVANKVILACLILSGCCKEDPETDLPRPEYFSCYINGEVFTTLRGVNCDPMEGHFYDGQVGDTVLEKCVSVIGTNCSSFMSINFGGCKLPETNSLSLEFGDTVHDISGNCIIIEGENPDAYVYKGASGNVHYSEISYPYKVGNTPHTGYAKGTFEFTAVNSLNDTVHITSGQFGVILHR